MHRSPQRTCPAAILLATPNSSSSSSSRVQTMTEPAAQASRNIVVAVDATDACVAAVQYAVSEICRPGDVLHICHTAKVLPPPYTISHVAPQTTFDVPEGDIDRQQLLRKVQEFVKVKFQSHAEICEVPCVPHIYLDTDNATPADIAGVICSTCSEVAADLLIIAHQDVQEVGLVGKLAAVLLPAAPGGVLQAVLAQSRVPLLVVKDYTPGQYDQALLSTADAGASADVGRGFAADAPAGAAEGAAMCES